MIYPVLFYIAINGAVFTFDDGPSRQTTKILDILNKNKVKAVFCIVSSRLYNKNYLAIAKRALKEGHIICNHSYNHPNFARISANEQLRQIVISQKIIKKKLGIYPSFFRPPYGVITTAIRKVTKEHNLTILMWHIDPRDWASSSTPASIYNKIIWGWTKRKGKQSILLFHDTKINTVLALEKIIKKIKK